MLLSLLGMRLPARVQCHGVGKGVERERGVQRDGGLQGSCNLRSACTEETQLAQRSSSTQAWAATGQRVTRSLAPPKGLFLSLSLKWSH